MQAQQMHPVEIDTIYRPKSVRSIGDSTVQDSRDGSEQDPVLQSFAAGSGQAPPVQSAASAGSDRRRVIIERAVSRFISVVPFHS